jgi:DNA-binding IclR family transcriptional regulator
VNSHFGDSHACSYNAHQQADNTAEPAPEARLVKIAETGSVISLEDSDGSVQDGAQLRTRAHPEEGGNALLDLAAQRSGAQTLLRGLAVLEAVARGGRELRQLSAALGMTRSTTQRLVNALTEARFLRAVPGGSVLGPKLIELGTVALEQMPLIALARPHLAALADVTRDTIHLGVRDGDRILYIDKIACTRGLEMRSRIGHRMPLASTGIGKALMLDLPPAQWRQQLEAARHPLAGMGLRPARECTVDEFLRTMPRYAALGCSLDLEENEASIRCVAAPVRDASGAIVAALSVASTVPYMPMERMETLIPVVQRTALAISTELGWRATPSGPARRARGAGAL